MICSAKPVLTQELCVVQKQEFFTWRKAKHMHERHPYSRQRGCYIMTIIARVHLGENIPWSWGLKGLEAKTNWLAVKCQSWSNFDFESFELNWVSWLVSELITELKNCWGSVVVSCCNEDLVAEAGVSSGTQTKGNVRCWKPLRSKG
jgi:hypothetical protein